VLDGIIKNAEIAAKEDINSGIPLTATPEMLHRQLVSLLSESLDIPMDVFDKLEVVREERYCIPSYHFACTGTASFTYESGVQRKQTYTVDRGDSTEIREKTYTDWVPSGSSVDVTEDVFAPGNKDMASQIQKLYMHLNPNKLHDIQELEFPPNVKTYGYNLPQPAAFNGYVKPYIDKILEEKVYYNVAGKNIRNLDINGSRIQKEIIRVFLGLYSVVYKYGDQEYTMWTTGDGQKVLCDELPFDTQRGQKQEVAELAKAMIPQKKKEGTGWFIFGLLACVAGVIMSLVKGSSTGWHNAGEEIFWILLCVVGIIYFGVKIFKRNEAKKYNIQMAEQIAKAEQEAYEAQKSLEDYEDKLLSKVQQFKMQNKTLRGIYWKGTGDYNTITDDTNDNIENSTIIENEQPRMAEYDEADTTPKAAMAYRVKQDVELSIALPLNSHVQKEQLHFLRSAEYSNTDAICKLSTKKPANKNLEKIRELKSKRSKAILVVCTLGLAANPFSPLKRASNKITSFFGGGDSHLVQGMLGFLFILGIPIVLLMAMYKNIMIWINCQSEISELEKEYGDTDTTPKAAMAHKVNQVVERTIALPPDSPVLAKQPIEEEQKEGCNLENEIDQKQQQPLPIQPQTATPIVGKEAASNDPKPKSAIKYILIGVIAASLVFGLVFALLKWGKPVSPQSSDIKQPDLPSVVGFKVVESNHYDTSEFINKFFERANADSFDGLNASSTLQVLLGNPIYGNDVNVADQHQAIYGKPQRITNDISIGSTAFYFVNPFYSNSNNGRQYHLEEKIGYIKYSFNLTGEAANHANLIVNSLKAEIEKRYRIEMKRISYSAEGYSGYDEKSVTDFLIVIDGDSALMYVGFEEGISEKSFFSMH
jgi:hypothetical protein